jgi:hypothetical protein
MIKQPHHIDLTAMIEDMPVNTNNWYDRTHFVGSTVSVTGYYRITETLDDTQVCVRTPKGVYYLDKHPVNNIYKGTINGIKVQVSLKKMVGTLIYWA